MEVEENMNRIKLGWRGLAAAAVIACLAVGTVYVDTAQAQFDPNTVPNASNLRALFANSWNNNGVMGGNQQFGRGNKRNAYPRNGNGPGSFGAVLSQFTSNQKSQMYNEFKTSGGEGMWIVNASAGTVTTTGPRSNPGMTDFIRPLPYDPANEEEATWGVPNPLNLPAGDEFWASAGDRATLSNWWPGVVKTDDGSLYTNDLGPGTTPPAHIANYALGGFSQVDVTKPEEMIIARWVDIKNGVRVTRKVYNWSTPDFDDFYIVSNEITNLGDFDGDGVGEAPARISNLYVGFKNSFGSTAMGMGEEFGWSFYGTQTSDWDDIIWYTESGGYPNATSGNGAFVGEDMRAVVRRDSDDPFSTFNDVGDPKYKAFWPTNYDILQSEGQPTAPSTYFMAPIAFTNTAGSKWEFNSWDQGRYVSPADDNQPFGFQWWSARGETDISDTTPTVNTDSELAATVMTAGFATNPDEGDTGQKGMFLDMTSYGPYDVGPGESIKIVLAWGAGHPSQMAGAPPAGTGGQAPWWDIIAWDRRDVDYDTAKIPAIKADGEAAALENLKLAHFAYDNNYQVPVAPTEAFISEDNLASSGDARQIIRFGNQSESAINPYTGTADVLGYRVYKSTWFSWGPWELYQVIPPGSSGNSVVASWSAGQLYEMEDLNTAAGFSYFYSVRPYAKAVDASVYDASWALSVADIPSARVQSNIAGGYENGYGPPTARTYDGEERKPFQPVTAETNALDKKILVVPNPYFADGNHQYPNSRNLRIVGLPAKCQVHIYSASGDRVQTIDHDDAAKGETPFKQITFNISGEVQTGLYYYVVVNDAGKTQTGSFVLIK